MLRERTLLSATIPSETLEFVRQRLPGQVQYCTNVPNDGPARSTLQNMSQVASLVLRCNKAGLYFILFSRLHAWVSAVVYFVPVLGHALCVVCNPDWTLYTTLGNWAPGFWSSGRVKTAWVLDA